MVVPKAPAQRMQLPVQMLAELCAVVMGAHSSMLLRRHAAARCLSLTVKSSKQRHNLSSPHRVAPVSLWSVSRGEWRSLVWWREAGLLVDEACVWLGVEYCCPSATLWARLPGFRLGLKLGSC